VFILAQQRFDSIARVGSLAQPCAQPVKQPEAAGLGAQGCCAAGANGSLGPTLGRQWPRREAPPTSTE
jgi:hypothetical protein